MQEKTSNEQPLTLESALKTIEKQDFIIHKLSDEIAWFRRQTFGSKTERFISNDQQCDLDLGVEPQEGISEAQTEEITYTREKKSSGDNSKGHGRTSWPDHLPREKKVISPDFDTTDYKKISEKVTETLQYTPPKFWILQEIRGVYKKIDSETTEILTPELPPRIIDQGNVGASVVAQLLVDKCTFHLPVYRTTKKWKASSNIAIPDSTAYDWFAKGCFWFDVIRREMLKKIKSSGYVQLDESTIKVQVKKKKGKCHQGSMIVVHDPVEKLVVFTYRNNKNKQGSSEVLGNDYTGVFQTDCCSSYLSFAAGENIDHAGCNAHSRRYFEEALNSDRKNAEHMLKLYQKLFNIEKEAKDKHMTFDERFVYRNEKSRPVIKTMKTWLNEKVATEIPKGRLGKAITYTLNHWKELTAFLNNGIIELSNNWIESVIRLLAMGRKNFMFAGSVSGAHNLAIAYSIMATCKLNGINPYDYVLSALEQLPARKANNVNDLIPTEWDRSIKNNPSEE